MVDISEKIGRASCSELQNDFPAKDVMFLVADVTKREQLVKCVCSFVGLPPPNSNVRKAKVYFDREL